MQVENNDKVIKGSLFLLIFFLPLIFDPSTFSAFSLPKLVLVRIVTAVVVFAWLAKVLAEGHIRIRRSSLNIPLIVFALVAVVSTVESVHLRTAIFGEYNVYEGSLTLLNYLFLCFVALNFLERERDCYFLVSILLLSASLVSIMGILDYLGVNYYSGLGGFKADGYIRSSATFGNPVILGAYLSLVFPLALTLFVRGVFGKGFRWLALISLSTMLPAILFTGSRGAWVGVGAGLILVLVFAVKDFSRKKQFAMISAAVVLILIIGSILAVLSNPYLRERALSMFHPRLGGSVTDRLMIWRTTMPIIASYPALGTGPDTLGLVFARFKTRTYARSEAERAITSKAHNEFLQVAATVGLLGLVAYLWIVVLTFWKGFKGVNQANSLAEKSLVLALLAGFLSYFVQLQFSFSFIAFAPIFWVLLGGMFSLVEERDKVPSAYLVKLPPVVCKRWKVICLFLGVASLLLAGLSIKPWIADYFFTRGEDYKATGAIDRAVREYQLAVSWNGAEERYWYSLANAYLNKAFSYSDLKDFCLYFNRAINGYRKAQKINLLDEASYYYAGYAYQMGGQRLRYSYFFAQAAKMNRRVLELNPNSVDGHLNLGTALASVNLVDEAIYEWKKAKWLDPKRIDAYYNLGWAYEKQGTRDKAVLEFQSVLRLDPNNVDARRAIEQLQD